MSWLRVVQGRRPRFDAALVLLGTAMVLAAGMSCRVRLFMAAALAPLILSPLALATAGIDDMALSEPFWGTALAHLGRILELAYAIGVPAGLAIVALGRLPQTLSTVALYAGIALPVGLLLYNDRSMASALMISLALGPLIALCFRGLALWLRRGGLASASQP